MFWAYQQWRRATPAVASPRVWPTTDPSVSDYVWHCHILEHEDNDMMLPYRVEPRG